jgi:hypothetical protein
MTGISPTQQQLRRIDQQLTSNRQQIAVLQLENVQLENARLVLLGLAEQDAIAAGRPGLAGLQIRVGPPAQEVLHLADEGAASRPTKRVKQEREAKRDYKTEYRRRMQAKGLTAGGKPRKRLLDKLPANMIKREDGSIGPRERAVRSDKGKNKNTAKARALNEVMRNRILTSLEHRAEPVTNGQLIEAFGLTDAKDKSRLYNAMSSLKRNGAVVQDDSYRYTLVRGNGHAAN